MDATPGTDSLAFATVSPAAPPPHRSAWRLRMGRWWLDGALISFVLVLGLLQGSRAALGRMPLSDVSEPPAVTAPPPADVEADGLHGRFFRPDDSSAVRPALRLRQSVWRPAGESRVASACIDSGC